jgi:poly-gamma-glutamate capsule biosynthesis protein CapA/YwtB (metallophosphatase superfamily)
VSDALRNADVVFGNLECCFFDRAGHDPGEREGFYAPPAAVGALAHHDAVGCANNVTYGEDAVMASLARLDEQGVAHTGAGENLAAARTPAIVERDGQRYGFLQRTSIYWPKNQEATKTRPGVAILKAHTAYRPRMDELAPNRPGVAPEIITWTDPDSLRDYKAEIAALAADTNFAVASHHWGPGAEILAYQREIAHAAIDSGAGAVMGHGPHMALGIEIYHDQPIFYGLVNFSFDIGHRGVHGPWVGLVPRLVLNDGVIHEAAFRLVRRDEDRQTYFCNPADEKEFLTGLVERSAGLGATFDVQEDRVVIWRRP